jgi:hypothetical protein
MAIEFQVTASFHSFLKNKHQADKMVGVLFLAAAAQALTRSDSGVLLLNEEHRIHPLTIFDTETSRIDFPALLTESSPDILENQIFTLKYSKATNSLWLDLKKMPDVKLNPSGSALHASVERKYIQPLHVSRMGERDHFNIEFRRRCLSVDGERVYKGKRVWTLSFKACDPRDRRQMFRLVPADLARMKLGLLPETDDVKGAIMQSVRRNHLVLSAINSDGDINTFTL